MFGVVWLHSVAHPGWLTAPLVNSTFFFLSGVFFKPEAWNLFIRKKVRTLLIPFLAFYLLCYPYRIIEHYWDFRTLEGFEWGCIFDLFDIVGRSDYLFVNVPLWFLLCLFWVQVFYRVLFRLNKFVWILLIGVTIIFKDFINEVPSPFMMNNACYWIGFFAAGHLCGKWLIHKMKAISNRIMWLVVSVAVTAMLTWSARWMTNQWVIDILYQLKMYAVFGILFAAGAFFDGMKVLKPIRFLGLNSLAMLCMHVPPLIVFGRIAGRLSGHQPAVWAGFVCALLTCFVCYFAIRFCNKYCPVIVGKTRPKLGNSDR